MPRKTIIHRLAVASTPLVVLGNRELRGYSIISDKTADVSVKFYDGAATGGEEIWEDALVGDKDAKVVMFPFPFETGTELRVVLSGANSILYVHTN